MKLFIKALTVLTILCTSLFSSEESLIKKIHSTVTVLSSEKGHVWKDFDLLETPLVITFPNGHVYAFGLKTNNLKWQTKQIENATFLFSDQDHWNLSQIAMQDKFLIDGQEAFVFRIDEDKNPANFKERPILVLVHELFHRYQFSHFEGVKDIGQYADGLNIENLALIHLEERILTDFIMAEESDKLDILKNYMAIHEIRSRIINPSSLNWEYFQQMMEGLADYTSIQTFKKFQVLENFSDKHHLNHLFTGYIHSKDPQELAVKWRHYGVGAMIGFSLDFLHVENWKDRVEKGEPQGVILKEALFLSETEKNHRIGHMKALYDYDLVFSKMEQKVNSFQEMLESYLSEYDAEDGIIAHIGRPSGVNINGGGSNYGIFHLQDGNTMLLKDKSFSSSPDNSWEIEFKDIPLFFQDKAGDRIVKVDPDLQIMIDGIKHPAKKLMETKQTLFFDTIFWECETSRFKSTLRSGQIEFNSDGFFVNFF